MQTARDTIETASKFWMVWNPSRNNPRYRHASKELAEAEARRLASERPNEPFFVLKATAGFVCTVSDPRPLVLTKDDEAAKRQASDPHGEIPF